MSVARHIQILNKLPTSFSVADVVRVGCYKRPSYAERVIAQLKRDRWITVESDGVWRVLRRPVCKNARGKGGGKWQATGEDPVIALGPRSEMFDGEGRKYEAQWAAVRAQAVIPSHDIEGRALENYAREFQARDRAGAASRVQLQRLLNELQPDRLISFSSTPADSAPVVWWSGKLNQAGFQVLSGNGRAAVIKAALASKQGKAYTRAIGERWPALPRVVNLSNVMIVRLLKVSKAQAVKFAGASQTTGAGAQTQLEEAVGLVRGLGLDGDPLAGAPFFWTKPITSETVRELVASNPTWWREVSNQIDAARRASIEATPERLAEVITGVLLGGLPPEALRVISGRLQEAQIGALGAVWSLESGIRSGRVGSQWGLIRSMAQAATLYQSAGSLSLRKLTKRIEEEARQTQLGEGSALGNLDRLSAALGVGLLKAARRADPISASSGYLSSYVDQAYADDPAQVSMFGERPSPSATLAAAVGWRDPRPVKNPREDQWVLLGDQIGFKLTNGKRVELAGDWVIATEPDMSSVFLVNVTKQVQIKASRGAASTWKRWTKGRPDAVYKCYRPSHDSTRKVEGEIHTIYYRAVYRGDIETRYHPFDGPGPLLVAYRDGPQIERGESRYTIEPRGIVG